MTKVIDSLSKNKNLDSLSEAIKHCSLCERMCHRTKIFTTANGNVNSKVLFIAEAPGRLGADKTGIPLYGDRTGFNYELFIKRIGWNREDIFITNAVLCNPRENGTNDTPTLVEIQKCSTYLSMTLELIQPQVIVTLGRVALDALNFLFPHKISLSTNVATPIGWKGFTIFPLYHPGPRALIHRSLSKQMSDYITLSKLVHPIKGMYKKENYLSKPVYLKNNYSNFSAIQQIIFALLLSLKETSFFRLNKLIYLVDLHALINFGNTISDEIYLRQEEGPWLPKLRDYMNDMNGNELYLTFKNRKPFVKLGSNVPNKLNLNDKYLDLIASVLAKYGHMDDSKIKTSVYLTEPMRYIIKKEKSGHNFLNKPVLYKNKTIIEIDSESANKDQYE